MSKWCPLIKKNCIGKKCISYQFMRKGMEDFCFENGKLVEYRKSYGCKFFDIIIKRGKWIKAIDGIMDYKTVLEMNK